MRRFCLFACFWIGGWGRAYAQFAEEEPLSRVFYKHLREELRAMMPSRSVAVFFASPLHTRSNDVKYVYQPERNLFYLTGFNEPHALLLIFKEPQSDPKTENLFDEVLFTRTRSSREELYNGPRLSPEDVMSKLGIQLAYSASDFANLKIDLASLDKIMFLPFPTDLRDTKDTTDLYDLILQFKAKAHYPLDYTADKHTLYKEVSQKAFLTHPSASARIEDLLEKRPELRREPTWQYLSAARTPEQRLQAISSLNTMYKKLDPNSLSQIMTTLREIKTPEEIALLRRAINISCIAQNEVMRSIHPNMSEQEVQGIHEFIYRKYGVAHEGYPSIVGAGNNGCVLHYIKNNKEKIGKDQLVLMDLGAEYYGYTADVTRTIPASGQFTEEQRVIYELVLKAQEKALRICKSGTSFLEINRTALQVVAIGLQRLGIIDTLEKASRYLPHGVTHHIGLDVHDPGHYQYLAANMVITIEPGIYIPEGSPCEKKWWNTAIRIEDNILITETGYELLSSYSPRKAEEIEKLMAAPKTFFYNYELPSLKKRKADDVD